MSNITTTTASVLADAYLSARADLATAETAYLATAGAWADAVAEGAVSVAALGKAAGIEPADAKAYRWLGECVRAADGGTECPGPFLPYRGVVALEADVRAILKSGKGATEDLAEVLSKHEDQTLTAIAEAVATLAAKRTRKATAKRTAKATAKADEGTGQTGSGTLDPRSLDALLADTLALLARIDRVADTMTPDQAATLAVIGAGVESIATRAIVANA